MSFKPHVVKLEKGQATFIYMSEEAAEKYAAILTSFDKADKSLGGEQMALGMFKDTITKKFNLVTIKYNPLTKEAKVDTIEETSGLASYAANKFKLAVLKHKII